MTAYVVFQFNAIDPEKISRYVRGAMTSVVAHGGRMLAVGEASVLHQSRTFDQGAVLEFLDRAAARAWYESLDYQSLIALRTEAMDCAIVLIG